MGLLSYLRRAVTDFVQVAPDGTIRAKALPAKARTLGEFWTQHHAPYLLEQRKGTRKQQTYRFSVWIEPALGHLRWSELAPVVESEVAHVA